MGNSGISDTFVIPFGINIYETLWYHVKGVLTPHLRGLIRSIVIRFASRDATSKRKPWKLNT